MRSLIKKKKHQYILFISNLPLILDSKANAEADARIKKDSITTLEMHHSSSVIEKDTIESG